MSTLYYNRQIISVKKMKNQSYRLLQRENSNRSLNKIKYEVQRNNNQSVHVNKKKEEGNLYTITTNTVNFSSNKQQLKKEQEQSKRIKILENELKKRLIEDSILRNLFKTKTHTEMSHIDLYLEIRKLEQALKNSLEREKEQRNKFLNLEERHKRQEEEHLRYIEILDESIQEKERQWRAQKQRLQQQNNQLKEDSQNYKFLLQQIKKKYAALNQKLKETNDELQIERQAKILGELKQKQQHQNQISTLLLDLQQQEKQNNELKAQIQICMYQIEQTKDEKQKLQLRIKQFQEVNNDFNYSKRQQKEKYQQYYQKLKVDYEKEIQSILQQHEIKMKDEVSKYTNLHAEKSKLEKQIDNTKNKLQQYKDIAQRIKEDNKKIVEQNQNYRSQFDCLQAKNAKISRDLLQIRFEKDQNILQIQKLQVSLQQKIKLVTKLQGRISEVSSNNANLQVECDQYKRQAQANQSYLKINNKVYNDNYKTLGRLIQINNKIKANLNINKEQQKVINEQSLGQVVSYLTELLQKFITAFTQNRKKHQEFIRERNIENRQIINVIEQCKHFINNEYAENLINKYIFFVKDRKSISNQQSNEKLQIYHELIENLMNLNSVKNYHSENQQINLKDSLQSTYLQRDVSTSNKFTHRLIEKSQSNKLIRRRERLSTEPVCDLPLKIQLFQEDENKQNLHTNLNKNIFEHHHSKQQKTYINGVRQKISNKLCEKRGQSRNSVKGRSQIQKKYFRS